MKVRLKMKKTPTVLLILDGFGLNEKTEGNAIKLANTPNMDSVMSQYPWVQGNASEEYVGLPKGQMGNSEVGHMNMGAGRIVYQALTRITKAIKEGTFFENEALLSAINNCKKNNSALHVFGLISDGGVHSHLDHLYGLLDMAKRHNVETVYVHCFLDGRDTPPTSGKDFVAQLESKMQEIGIGEVATVSGRYYAMDRDTNYDRIKVAYDNMTNPTPPFAASATAGIQSSYDNDENDEFVVPFSVGKNGKALTKIKEDDSIVFINFRPDRAREITRAFCDDDFKGFERSKRMNLCYVCFTDYDPTIPNKLVAFDKQDISNTFGQWLASNNMTQARIAETEKYAHVTFFFNGGVEKPNPGEDRILVPSPKVSTYDLQPEMSVYAVCDNMVKAIHSGKYDVIITNFANPDMVGHTGILEAAIKAIEAVDECVGKVITAVKDENASMIICADHGNAEQLIDYETHESFTAHTTNPVPFILVNYNKNYALKPNGCLADIVPTLIEMMDKEQPKEMTGKSLLVKKN